MRVFLIHIRDPQFYALPSTTAARNGNIRVMGFPPIGIMSLSAVLKRDGHECVMFDQANPETPNEDVVDEMKPKRDARRENRRGGQVSDESRIASAEKTHHEKGQAHQRKGLILSQKRCECG